MPSLKTYRDRIASVKSTKKITSAMKMVAASKLKKAQDQAESAQPYARAMGEMLSRVASRVTVTAASPKLLIGTGSDERHLLVVVTSDRGLCGGFNGNLVRLARLEIARLKAEGKKVQIVTIGRKARDLLKREHGDIIVQSYTGFGSGSRVNFAEANQVTQYVLEQFEAGKFDVCSLIYNSFVSVLTQRPTAQLIIPFELPKSGSNDNADKTKDKKEAATAQSPYSFEPSEEGILAQLLPRNLGVQLFRGLLDSAAGEQAARMTAMDNATRNAGDRINGLTLEYNRARQAAITKELIEIISGAEAL
ncbi:MAG: F0F1 ATP synthase subunit gamma [Alphaproteobacteria bacterium]|nr:F0F1 ATP synthase subunit gamma [Alphaproteobacteria bacterium]NCQ89065.1 F0F1 ATP synthase subunit gamma [Alphaproteobacteria bacterium]NCT07965.1 F0F1 ATP synthase subunit gamma [Alphaproteobacteria bacterium]